MTFSSIKLIGLDLDGTLLGEDSCVHSRERGMIQQARQSGAAVALTTGRSIRDTIPHAHAAGGVDWLITENGARITSSSGETIFQNTMSAAQLQLLLTLCETHGVEPSLYGTDHVWYGSQCMAFFKEIARRRGGAIPLRLSDYRYVETFAQWQTIAAQETIYKAIVYGDAAQLDDWFEALQQTNQFEAEPSVYLGLKNIEINRRGTDKGRALLWLAEQLGLNRGNVMACGDSDNDRTMLQCAGLGVAMGNAPQHIRQLADVTTDTNRDHGVCRAIEQYVLCPQIKHA